MFGAGSSTSDSSEYVYIVALVLLFVCVIVLSFVMWRQHLKYSQANGTDDDQNASLHTQSPNSNSQLKLDLVISNTDNGQQGVTLAPLNTNDAKNNCNNNMMVRHIWKVHTIMVVGTKMKNLIVILALYEKELYLANENWAQQQWKKQVVVLNTIPIHQSIQKLHYWTKWLIWMLGIWMTNNIHKYSKLQKQLNNQIIHMLVRTFWMFLPLWVFNILPAINFTLTYPADWHDIFVVTLLASICHSMTFSCYVMTFFYCVLTLFTQTTEQVRSCINTICTLLFVYCQNLQIFLQQSMLEWTFSLFCFLFSFLFPFSLFFIILCFCANCLALSQCPKILYLWQWYLIEQSKY